MTFHADAYVPDASPSLRLVSRSAFDPHSRRLHDPPDAAPRRRRARGARFATRFTARPARRSSSCRAASPPTATPAARDGNAGWWRRCRRRRLRDRHAAGFACSRSNGSIAPIRAPRRCDGPASRIGSEDQADAIAALLLELGIRRLHAFVGASYGAMVGLAFAARHPERVRRLVAIAGAHRAHPLAIAVRNLQREIVRLGRTPRRRGAGLDLARRLAMTTYRGEREFAERCDARARVIATAATDSPKKTGSKPPARASCERFERRALPRIVGIDRPARDRARGSVRVPSTLIGIAIGPSRSARGSLRAAASLRRAGHAACDRLALRPRCIPQGNRADRSADRRSARRAGSLQ